MVEQFLFGEVSQIDSADAHAAAVRVLKACDELGERRLARAGGAHERGDGAGGQVLGDILDGNRLPVPQCHVVDIDRGVRRVAARGLRQVQRRRIEGRQDSSRGRPRHLRTPGEVAERFHRVR